MHDKIIEDHDNTKCKYDGPTPGNCCGNQITSHCAENYQTIWGGKCGFKNDMQHYKMFCVPVKEETKALVKENSDPTKCGIGHNIGADVPCCGLSSKMSCADGYAMT